MQLVLRNPLWTVGLSDVVGVTIPFDVVSQQLRGTGALLEQSSDRAELRFQLGDACVGLAQRRLALLAVSTYAGAVHNAQMHTADRAGATKNRLCRL